MKSHRIVPEELGRTITHLPPYLRASTHDTTGLTPARLVFGRELYRLATCCLGHPPPPTRNDPQPITRHI
jgi:hypothetical protein